MSYRRRQNPIAKVCQQCQSSFDTWHAGRIYCGQACNMTAWRHRHKLPTDKVLAEPVNDGVGKISFSLPNLTTIAAGSLLADGAMYLLNDQPTMVDLLKRVETLEFNMGWSMGSLVSRIKALQDHNKAVEQADPALALSVSVARQQRLSAVSNSPPSSQG